jgi:hypothetical protein
MAPLSFYETRVDNLSEIGDCYDSLAHHLLVKILEIIGGILTLIA